MLTAHRQSPNRSREQRERLWAKVEAELGGNRVICGRCKATLSSFADVCTADLDEPCPGFVAVDKARTAARAELGIR